MRATGQLSSPTVDIVAALDRLAAEEYDRLRLRLWRQFGRQLSRIPDAPSPDDLLHEAIEDLLADRRHCPLSRIELTTCLLNIVRSKVSHLYAKWKREGIVKVSDQVLNMTPAPADQPSELRGKIVAFVSDDPLLRRIIEYRLDYPEAKAREIAEALQIELSEMYNANRRLKARLRRLDVTF
jgi:DNA-directed RNA polymerase specialized sigma24 family protein